jgi:hypothetical protein
LTQTLEPQNEERLYLADMKISTYIKTLKCSRSNEIACVTMTPVSSLASNILVSGNSYAPVCNFIYSRTECSI